MNYNTKTIFETHIIFSEHEKSGVCFYSTDLKETAYLVSKGWNVQKVFDFFRVTPPVVSVADIVDCKKIMQYGNAVLNLAYFIFLQQMIRENQLYLYINRIRTCKKECYYNFAYHLSKGKSIEAEIMLYGSDDRIVLLKNDMFSVFIEDFNWRSMLHPYKDRIFNASPFKERPSSLNSVQVSSALVEIETCNAQLGRSVSCDGCGFFINKTAIQSLKYDVLLLLQKGCFKFIKDLVDEDNINKIMLWEFHLWENDFYPTHFEKMRLEMFQTKLACKKILVADSVYSGKTLLTVKKFLLRCDAMPITLAIYPKSRYTIKNFDYAFIGDTIRKSNEFDSNKSDFFINEYVKMISREQLCEEGC